MRQTAKDLVLAAFARTGWRGVDRLLRVTGYRSGDLIRAKSKFGTWFDLDPWSYIDRIVLRDGYYESEVVTALVKALGNGGVLWDVGANIGLHGITAKAMVPAAEVYCFEPSPVVVGKLSRNAALNPGRISVTTAALSDAHGFQVLHIADSGNAGMTTLSPWSELTYSTQAVVATVRGDDLIASGALPAPTVIKVDVEGHESQVLAGLARTLASPDCRCVVFEGGLGQTDVTRQLRGASFNIAILERQEHTDHALHNFVATK